MQQKKIAFTIRQLTGREGYILLMVWIKWERKYNSFISIQYLIEYFCSNLNRSIDFDNQY